MVVIFVYFGSRPSPVWYGWASRWIESKCIPLDCKCWVALSKADRWYIRELVAVSSSIRFFLVEKLFGQKPRGQHTQCDMMMPTDPISYLIIGQAALAFGTSKTFLDAIRLFDHSGVFVKISRFVVPWCFAAGKPISSIIAPNFAVVFTPLAHNQRLFIADFIFDHRVNTTSRQFHRQPTFVSNARALHPGWAVARCQ